MSIQVGFSHKNKEYSYVFVLMIFVFAIAISQLVFMASSHAAQPYGKVVYSRTTDSDNRTKIYTAYVGGAAEQRLSQTGSYSDIEPSVSADGKKIVFASDRDHAGQASDTDIYTMNKDGSNVVRLTNSASPKHEPSWSADGTKIVFSEEVDGVYVIKVMNADGTNAHEIVLCDQSEDPIGCIFPTVFGRYPVYLPGSNTTIAFSSFAGGIATVPVAGGTSPTTIVDSTSVAYPRFAFNGGNIVYEKEITGVRQLYTATSAGANPTALTTGGKNKYIPSYYPDGSQIFFLSWDGDDVPGIYSVDAEGGSVVKTPYGDGGPSGTVSFIKFMPGILQVTSATNNHGHDILTVTENISSQNYSLNDQTLIIGQNGSTGVVTLGDKAVLKGVGTAGWIAVGPGGTLAPGMSPGCLAAGGLTLAGGTFEVEVGGTTACTGYDKVNVTGTVSLEIGADRGTLTVSRWNSYVPAVGNTFTIIDNDDTEAVIGTFEGLSEGAEFTQDGVTYQISYVGGDGNDVTLKVIKIDPAAIAAANAPGAPKTGLAAFLTNPVTTIMMATACAATLYFLSRNKVFATQRSKR